MIELTDKSGNNIFKTLIKKAEDIHGSIRPCDGKENLEACITKQSGKIILWFMPNDSKSSAIAIYNTFTEEYIL